MALVHCGYESRFDVAEVCRLEVLGKFSFGGVIAENAIDLM